MRTRKPNLEISIQPEAIWDLIYAVTESAIIPPLLMRENRKRISHYKKFLKQPKRKNAPPNIIFSSTGLEISGFLLGSITNSDKRSYIIERAMPSVSANRADDWVECNHQSKMLIHRLNNFAGENRKILGQFHSHPEIEKESRYIEESKLNYPSDGDLISSKYERTINLIVTICTSSIKNPSYRIANDATKVTAFSYQGYRYWICGHKNRSIIPVEIPRAI